MEGRITILRLNKFDSIIDDIHQEYCRACRKWPEWPADLIHQIAIMQEESGEAIREALRYQYNEGGTIEDLKKELIQTGAMVIRCLINLKEK